MLSTRLLPLIATLAVLTSFPARTLAQSRPVDVKAGSPTRRAILDAIRPSVEKELKQKLIFIVNSMKTQRGFAFTQLQPRRPDGRPIDYSKTPYGDAIRAGAFDDGLFALLRKQKRGWKLLRYILGATDVPYVDWDKEFGAPRTLLGMPPRNR